MLFAVGGNIHIANTFSTRKCFDLMHFLPKLDLVVDLGFWVNGM